MDLVSCREHRLRHQVHTVVNPAAPPSRTAAPWIRASLVVQGLHGRMPQDHSWNQVLMQRTKFKLNKLTFTALKSSEVILAQRNSSHSCTRQTHLCRHSHQLENKSQSGLGLWVRRDRGAAVARLTGNRVAGPACRGQRNPTQSWFLPAFGKVQFDPCAQRLSYKNARKFVLGRFP